MLRFKGLINIQVLINNRIIVSIVSVYFLKVSNINWNNRFKKQYCTVFDIERNKGVKKYIMEVKKLPSSFIVNDE